MSAWIPALHAGMTESRIVLKLTEALQPRIFKGERKGRKAVAGLKPASTLFCVLCVLCGGKFSSFHAIHSDTGAFAS
jgi:hypothetical protein